MKQNAKPPVFACRRCGECCRGDKGILVTPWEADRLAAFLGLTLDDLYRRFFIASPLGPQLATRNGACVFLADNRCQVHPVKPRICRQWPFLPALLKHPDEFEAAREACPGFEAGCTYEEFCLLGEATASGSGSDPREKVNHEPWPVLFQDGKIG